MVKENGHFFQRIIGRRRFLKKTTAAASLSGEVRDKWTGTVIKALEAGDGTDTEAKDQIFYGSCRGNCFQGCRIQYIVRNGKVVKTEMGEFPDPAYNRICLKGYSIPTRIYSPHRIKYPMKRVGERGEGKWERISWDEAIDTIGNKWQELIDQYGHHSIAFSRLAGNSALSLANMSVLTSLIGGVDVLSNVDNALAKGVVDTLGIGAGLNSNDIADFVNCRTIIFWGSNVTESQIQQWHFFAAAKENGAKFICIDPNYTGLAAKSDYFVPIKPGTDSALAMAMINVVLEKGWEDIDYLKKATVASFLVREDNERFLRMKDVGGSEDDNTFVVWDPEKEDYGKLDETADPEIHGTYTIEGIKVTTAYDLMVKAIEKYTPDYASKICDVPVSLIYEITEVFAKNTPSSIFQGFGPQHRVNGHYQFISTATLSMVTGNLGKPGATNGFWRPQIGILLKMPDLADAKETLKITSLKFPEVMKTGMYGTVPMETPIKSIYIYASNFIGNLTDRRAMLKALMKLDLIVVADMRMTDTTRYADIVLPVAEWPEVLDLHGGSTLYPYMHLQEKAIEPLYEAKSDFEIAQLLGRKMGLGEYFEKDVDTFLGELMAIFGPDFWSQMKKETIVRMPHMPKTYIHGEGGKFPTPTGRAQFYIEDPCKGATDEMSYGQVVPYHKDRLPYWEPPNEAWDEGPLFEKYPLSVFMEHVKWRSHTTFSHVPWLKELDPEPIVKMNPDDAAARGIKTGDIVKVYNDRGYVVIKAVINNGLRPGMVNIPHGWQEDQFIEGHYTDLLSRALNPSVANQCYNDALVEIEKI